MSGGAVFSDCGRYRYELWRRWDADLPTVMFIMLNPSKANAECDDPTIRKCKHYAMAWGYGSLLVGNLFAWRATKPFDLKAAGRAGKDLVGPCNEVAMEAMVKKSGKVIAAWGNDGSMKGRSDQLREKIADQGGLPLHAVQINATGEPRHPLYVRRNLRCDELIPETCWGFHRGLYERWKHA